MDPKTQEQMLKEMKKMKKKQLKELQLDLADEQMAVQRKYKEVEASRDKLEKELFDAIDAKDSAKMDDVKAKLSILKDNLERLAKREKALSEELELASKVKKNGFDGESGIWMTVGAWVMGAATTGLSAWGLVKSHKSFEDGTLIDKSTKGLAERLSGLFSFMSFRK